MTRYVDGIRFVTEQCCNCGIPFAMTKDFKERRLNDHKSFYCPSGHSQYYVGKTEKQKLKEQLQKTQKALEAESGRAAALAEQKDRIQSSYKRMRNRVMNGVCPCCNRSFQNLMQHMKKEHPEFSEHKILKSFRDAFGLTQYALAKELDINQAYISSFENEHPIPSHAEHRIQAWLGKMDATENPN